MEYTFDKHAKRMEESRSRTTMIWIICGMCGAAFTFGFPEGAWITMFASLTYTLYEIVDSVRNLK